MAKGKNLKASLVVNGKIDGIGWRYGQIIQSKNGRLKEGVMLYNGQEHTVTGATFQIRRYVGNRVVYTRCGNDYNRAQAICKRLNDTNELQHLKAELGITMPGSQETKTLADLLKTFIAKYAHGSADTVYAYSYVGTEFVKLMTARGKTTPDLTEDDVIAFDRHLESIGNKKNTRATRYGYVRCFLKHAGLDPNKVISPEEHKKLKAKPKLAVETYSVDQITRLLNASSERHRLIWTAFWQLGLRDEELAFGFWCDVDFENAVWQVRFKQPGSFPWNLALAWKSKDSEERDIPIPAGLLSELAGLKKYAPANCPLVFPTRGNQADIKLLKALKADWRAAGLNCGHCKGCRSKKRECRLAKLKTFRSSYMTTMLNFTNSRNVQKLAGHSSLETTERYLKPAAMNVLQTAANAAFAVAA